MSVNLMAARLADMPGFVCGLRAHPLINARSA